MTATVLSECVRMGADGSGFIGSDVYDAEFDDFGSAWETDDSPGEETAVYRHIMAETEAVQIVPEEYGRHIVADIAGFVRRNAESLKAFAETWNRPEYQIDTTETGVWNGICTIHGLMCGNYPPEAYAWLAREWGCQE